MNQPHKKSVTLLELLIAISLLGILLLAFSSIDLFSRYHVRNEDIRMQLQNEASSVIEHMSKEVVKAIGSTVISGQEPVDLTAISGDIAIKVHIDYNQDGRRSAGDRWIAYRHTHSMTLNPDQRYQIWYYPDYVTSPNTYEVIARRISSFTRSVTDNYVFVEVHACNVPCWASEPGCNCGTRDNPLVEMRAQMKMPAVSTH